MATLRKAFFDGVSKAAKADKSLAGTKITAAFSDRVHQTFLDTLGSKLKTEGRVAIPGFGVFSVVCVQPSSVFLASNDFLSFFSCCLPAREFSEYLTNFAFTMQSKKGSYCDQPKGSKGSQDSGSREKGYHFQGLEAVEGGSAKGCCASEDSSWNSRRQAQEGCQVSIHRRATHSATGTSDSFSNSVMF